MGYFISVNKSEVKIASLEIRKQAPWLHQTGPSSSSGSISLSSKITARRQRSHPEAEITDRFQSGAGLEAGCTAAPLPIRIDGRLPQSLLERETDIETQDVAHFDEFLLYRFTHRYAFVLSFQPREIFFLAGGIDPALAGRKG